MATGPEIQLRDQILKALSLIQDPDLSKDIVSAGFVKEIIIKKYLLSAHDVSITLELTTPACPVKDWFKNEAKRLVGEIPTVRSVHVELKAKVKKDSKLSGLAMAGVKNLIAVGAGKGGVGKSTVAVNLAFTLKQLGAQVGLLDADIHGPSLAHMLNVSGMPEVKNSRIQPKLAYGVPVMSFAYFAPVGDAVIWRGSMTSKALEQMLFDVDWTAHTPNQSELDYLVVDLPPGTGDIPLTLMHKVAVSGAVVVSTPQELAWIDSSKAIAMYEKLKVPVLGLIENMSGFICPTCQTVTDIFGSGGAKAKAEKRGTPFLGHLPLDPRLMAQGDKGNPIVNADPTHPLSQAFLHCTQNLIRQLSIQQRHMHTESP
jgi:ATP-binding protein involved in chromosome partitioning